MREFGLQQRAAQFWRENLPSCVAFFFFFMLGAACGYAACRPLLGDALLDAARALLAGGSAPRLLAVAAVSLLHEGAWACTILFSGLQAWTVPLWMLCVALRGFAAGAAAALCALLQSPVLWLLFALTQAPLLPAALRLAAFAIRCLRAPRRGAPPLAEGLHLGATLLLIAALETALLPLLLYALAR